MKTTLTSPLTVPLLLIGLALTGCSQARLWPADGEVQVDPSKRVVLFAPVDAAALGEDYPTADLDLARDMATSLEGKYENIQAWVGETLPVSSSPRWTEGAIGAAAGANLVVLTEVLSVEVQTIATREYMVANLRMRALDANGDQQYLNELSGRALNESLPKLMGPDAQPPARAVAEAQKKLVSGLGTWVEGLSLDPKDWHKPVRDEAPLIDVVIDSMPPGADIYVDGTFRGTTPMVVPLAVVEQTVRLQRQGYQVWETKLTPDVGMNIKPGLEPLAGSQ